jgi:hypothetical protein
LNSSLRQRGRWGDGGGLNPYLARGRKLATLIH